MITVAIPTQSETTQVSDHRNSDCLPWRADVEARLSDGGARMERMEKSLNENTVSTKAIEANTSELVEAFKNLQAALKVLNWFGSMVKPLGYIAAFFTAVVSLYYALKGGHR